MNNGKNHHLSTPLIISSHSQIHHHHNSIPLPPILFLTFIALLSIWAAYESSKGFVVTIVKAPENDHNSIEAKKFNLMYVVNGKGERVIIRASKFVEKNLSSNAKVKHVRRPRRVVLELSGRSMSSAVEVFELRNGNEFVLILNKDLLIREKVGGDVDADVAEGILRGMTRVHMWSFYSQLGEGDVALSDVEEIEAYVIRKASKVDLIDFYRLL